MKNSQPLLESVYRRFMSRLYTSNFTDTKAMRIISDISEKNRKSMNIEWFLTPTQLLIQGQWWSNLSTHLLQMLQCLDRGVRITSHSGQSIVESNLSSRDKKGILGFSRNPGFLQEPSRSKSTLSIPIPLTI
mmetsp:Transcript_33079/g.37972  ORF Transcript_33079/g.37972 Transcript_33079/m.37972 type:complete len:132 (+) Transcript_33079:379-774(+)